ncbi:ABC transporter, substrate-binding protein, family 5 [Aedoeadaptatus nemausensis]|uniref:ABC transporter, substrate-binding protein, family 5 n=1 Tax=Aedoeadaptatus nemausensis TaxID=2582829 RepID=A0A6V6Y766_9FIRM|nr:peptide ABC transporter substrate-binding protein [Peptoniphilus nemausensis]CAC9935881.1 ABC transporter, substrate-binding protein, family 5 [Peptoniphilus nemausensis]
MKNRKVRLTSVLIACVMLLAACGGGAKNSANNGNGGEQTASSESGGEKILRTNNKTEPGSLDPAIAKGTHESFVIYQAFEGLMRYDENDELVPGQAESYEVSDDGMTYTFKLRDGLKWSNGDPLTAKDFEYAWKRVIDPELASEYSFQITTYVKGAEEYFNGEGSIDDVGIKALDDKTLEVQLKAPTPYFLDITAFYTLLPVNEKVVSENPDWAKDPQGTEFVSNGPFKITEWNHKENIKMVKNDNYFEADKVKLDGLYFDILEDDNTAYQKYEGGEYDVLVQPAPAVTAKALQADDPELKMGKDIGTYYFEFNTTKKPFSNAKVREALSLALDRKTIVENIAQGGQIPAEGMVPLGLNDDTDKDFREANGNLVAEDVAKAKELLAEGLKEEGMTAEDLKGFTLSYNTDEAHKKIAQAVQEMWKQNLGIEINLENMEFQVLLDNRKAGNFEIARAGWVGDYKDPMTMLDLYMTDNPQNDSKWSNKEYDELLKKAAASPDQKVRMDSMKAAEKILMEEKPIIPIYFYTQPRLEKSNVTGVYKPLLAYPRFIYADIEAGK